jgi:hypothetical protein
VKKEVSHLNQSLKFLGLIVEDLIMKDAIFLQTQIQCTMKSTENVSMGKKYGSMTADKLEKAIQDSQHTQKSQYLSSAENQFLRSIKSTSGKIPHSNEACSEA